MKKLWGRFLQGAEEVFHKAKEGVEGTSQRLKQSAEDLTKQATERAKERLVEEAKERMIREAKQELSNAGKKIAQHLGLSDELDDSNDPGDGATVGRTKEEEAHRVKEQRARELAEAEAASRHKDEERRKEREIDEELAALRRKLGKP